MLTDWSSVLILSLFPCKALKNVLNFLLKHIYVKTDFSGRLTKNTNKKNKSRIAFASTILKIFDQRNKYKHGAKALKLNGYQESHAFCPYENIRPI